MKIVTVVGARPQFIKAAAMSRVLRHEHREVLVHTGQHYDKNMSDIFFEELGIPKPEYNLGIAAGSHGQMTGRMLEAIEQVLQAEKPDALLVYGDTNSTLAGALAAVKLHVPVIHVEAGSRLGTKENPEEVNRILTDHVSFVLFACVQSAVDFLEKEGVTEHVHLVGDPMYDAFCYYSWKARAMEHTLPGADGKQYGVPQEYYYLTCHRQENTYSEAPLKEILGAMDALDAQVVYPVHPRNREMALDIKEKYGFHNVLLCNPVGYLTSIRLVSGAKKVVTDSGGVQREAFFAEIPCVTVFDYIVWPETMPGNWNQLAKADKHDILDKLQVTPEPMDGYMPFGDGHSCELMCDILEKEFD